MFTFHDHHHTADLLNDLRKHVRMLHSLMSGSDGLSLDDDALDALHFNLMAIDDGLGRAQERVQAEAAERRGEERPPAASALSLTEPRAPRAARAKRAA